MCHSFLQVVARTINHYMDRKPAKICVAILVILIIHDLPWLQTLRAKTESKKEGDKY